MTAFHRATQHYAQQAMTPGFWAHAQKAVDALESQQCHHGIYSGLKAAVGAAVKAQGYRPASHELGDWWILENKVPALVNGRKSIKGRHDA